MRLGLRPTVFENGTETWSQARKLYGGAAKIWERHRHRYEVNPKYVAQLNDSGLVFAGKDEKGERMQVLELPGTLRHLSPVIVPLRECSHLLRSPILCWTPSPSGVLHTPFEPITAVPWVRRCIIWPGGDGRAARVSESELPASTSR